MLALEKSICVVAFIFTLINIFITEYVHGSIIYNYEIPIKGEAL